MTDEVTTAKPKRWPFIVLTGSEVQSGLDRQRWAELLIEQLPSHHDGRNSWLMNYGIGDDAERLRAERGLTVNSVSRAINAPCRELAGGS